MAENKTVAKHKAEAKKAGLTLLGPRKGKDANYRNYRFNECRHERQIRTDGVRNESFTCQTCEETALDQPSNVYLIKIKVESFE